MKTGGKINIDGHIDVEGGIKADREIIADNLIAIGGFTSKRNVKVTKSIVARGKIEVEEDVECDSFEFKISGPSVINGKLQANKIKIDLDEKARNTAYLRVTEIVSPNKIDIDYVIAEKVICPKINAGENCRIGDPIDRAYDPS